MFETIVIITTPFCPIPMLSCQIQSKHLQGYDTPLAIAYLQRVFNRLILIIHCKGHWFDSEENCHVLEPRTEYCRFQKTSIPSPPYSFPYWNSAAFTTVYFRALKVQQCETKPDCYFCIEQQSFVNKVKWFRVFQPSSGSSSWSWGPSPGSCSLQIWPSSAWTWNILGKAGQEGEIARERSAKQHFQVVVV